METFEKNSKITCPTQSTYDYLIKIFLKKIKSKF